MFICLWEMILETINIRSCEEMSYFLRRNSKLLVSKESSFIYKVTYYSFTGIHQTAPITVMGVLLVAGCLESFYGNLTPNTDCVRTHSSCKGDNVTRIQLVAKVLKGFVRAAELSPHYPCTFLNGLHLAHFIYCMQGVKR